MNSSLPCSFLHKPISVIDRPIYALTFVKIKAEINDKRIHVWQSIVAIYLINHKRILHDHHID